MNRRLGVVLAVTAFAAAALLVPDGPRAAAQSTGDAPLPSGGNPAAALDYVGSIFDPAGGTFDFDVDARELKGLGKSVDNAHFSGQYTATPCPDAHGTAKASVTVSVKLTGGDLGVLQTSQVELPVQIDVNDKATYTKVRFAGRYFDKIRNTHGTLEDSVTRLQYNGTAASAPALG